MLVFRMDETNFAEGQGDGLRIATGHGLKVDFDEFVADGSTLGLWHLHDGACQGEGTGLADASGGGHDLVNHGAASVEDGYRFVRADADYMDASFGAQPARSALTLECWVRAYETPLNQPGQIAMVGPATTTVLTIRAYRASSPTGSYIQALLLISGAGVGVAHWGGAEANAVLASSEPWHAAAVLDAPTRLRLFVNGVQRAEDTTGIVALPSGSWTLRLGKHLNGGTDYDLSAVLDEVRLSAAARYAANFTPHRLLAAGTYESPTFDAVRIQADWLDLVSEEDVPEGCEIGWEIKNGRLGEMIKNPSYSGKTVEFWNSCDAIADEKSWEIWGTPNCGKGQPGQNMPTSQGCSPARFRNVKVGN